MRTVIVTIALAVAFLIGASLPTPVADTAPLSPCAAAILSAQDVALEGDASTAPPVNAVLSADEAITLCDGGHVPNVELTVWEDGSLLWIVHNLEGGMSYSGTASVGW